VKTFFIVSLGYQKIVASSARAAAEIVAAQPRIGDGKDFVVKSEREAKALVSMIVPHVGVSASGSVSVSVGGRRGPKAKARA
jgi:hypothetical protein